MAGSFANMDAINKKKNFTYIPPTLPTELVDTTSYTIDFAARKFVHIGIDPSEKFQVTVHLLTSSRHVKITPDFLKRIFSLMGNILSFVLEQPVKYKRMLFLETKLYKISSTVYGGENVLVIESKTQDGCRVLLNREDLIHLQYLEWCIFKTITRKSIITQPAVLKQFDLFLNYIDVESLKVDPPPKKPDEMMTFIKNIRDESVISKIPKNDVNFISQLKMYASSQLAEHWEQRCNGEMSPELFTESEMKLISPPRYSSMSPMHENLSQARVADEERGMEEFLTQAKWSPIRKTESLPIDEPESPPPRIMDTLPTYCFDPDNFAQPPPWYTAPEYNESSPTSPAVDENDGPTSFNRSPSILDFTGGIGMKKLKKRNAKRKLFLNDIV
ncbi:hypothetical protein AGLY_017702 [Aphis glycines]|uniref:Uncharacterized protein n=1 Tax=Aphis glycines TaxID=307491 RepID=A0A6G0SUW6_APHGL|nr:hypothetical protein AGLY_017702 [Aphis glycines]